MNVHDWRSIHIQYGISYASMYFYILLLTFWNNVSSNKKRFIIHFGYEWLIIEQNLNFVRFRLTTKNITQNI